MKINKKYYILTSLFIVVFGLLSFFITKDRVHADAPTVNLTGWAWSSNIGWVSFSSTNSGSGGGNYSVTLATSTGALSGYAWSSNIGWIKFAGDGSHANPTVTMETGAVSGWARACSGTINGDCASADRTDGWDGWIELSGPQHFSVAGLTGTATSSAGVSYNRFSGGFSGYAWSNVIGWLSFDAGVSPVTCAPNCGGGGGGITASCTVPASMTIPTGQTSITLTSANGLTVGSYANGTGPYSFTPASFSLTEGMYPISVTIRDSASPQHTATISCGNVVVTVSGGTPTAKMWVNNNPALTTTKIKTGNSAKLNWSVADYVNSGYTSCVGQGSSLPNWSGVSMLILKPDDNGEAVNNDHYPLTIYNQGVYTLKIRCSNPDDQLQYRETNSIQVIVSNSTIEEI